MIPTLHFVQLIISGSELADNLYCDPQIGQYADSLRMDSGRSDLILVNRFMLDPFLPEIVVRGIECVDVAVSTLGGMECF